MDERLVAKQYQVAAFQIVLNTYIKKQNPTGVNLAWSCFETSLSSMD
jgi:hypothetical protein